MNNRTKPAIVIDCSVTMSWCFDDEADKLAEASLDLIDDHVFIVPAIWPIEVANVLKVGEARHRITSEDVTTFFESVNYLPISVESSPHQTIFNQVFSLAKKTQLSLYDASYLELALRKNIPLLTFDKALKAAAKQHSVHFDLETRCHHA